MCVVNRIFSLLVATLFVAVSIGYCQTKTDCDSVCVSDLKLAIERNLSDFEASFSVKPRTDFGDRIAIGIRKIYSNKELTDTETLRGLFEIIHATFANREELDPSDVSSNLPPPSFL